MSDCDSCWYANKAWDYCPIHYPGKQIEDCPAYCRDDVCTVEEEIRQEDSQMYSNDIIFCPHCRRSNYDHQTICQWCGEEL